MTKKLYGGFYLQSVGCRFVAGLFCFLLGAVSVFAQEVAVPVSAPLWLRYAAISPDGKTIAFAFRGHLFTVPAAGGSAIALTAGPTRDFAPVWSPDGKALAYASDSYGNFDVFLAFLDGRVTRRLTTYSTDEVPTGFTPDGANVLFSAHRMDSVANAQFPAKGVLPELYQVSTEGGRAPLQILTTPALAAHYDRAGQRLIYEDIKGYENLWRKHHVSSVAHDLWLYDAKNGTHTQLTTFAGEDRNPVWAPDEKSVFYLSEKSGSFNVWQLAIDAAGHPVGEPKQITRFEKNPVRFLSIASTGELCFTYDGGIYTLPAAAGEPQKVALRINVADMARSVAVEPVGDGATEMSLNPDGTEVAFVVRGEIYVASVEHGDTKRITNTPGQERSVSFSPDGRRLLFAAEHDKKWGVYEAAITRSKEEEQYFFNSTVLEIHPVIENDQENFQPHYSPDGKEVAWLENRTTLKVINLASKKTRLILAGDKNYSYNDGDQWYDWSPDGQWFAVNFLDRNRWSSENGLVDAGGKQQLTNLTNSGYEDTRPIWDAEGNTLLWLTDRDGLHGTGSTEQHEGDVYAMFMNQKAFDRYNLSKSEYDILKNAEDEKKDKDDGKDEKKKDKKEDKEEPKLAKPIQIELADIEDREARLTLGSANVRDYALTSDGEKLIYLLQAGKGFELWQAKLRDKEVKRLAEFPEEENPNARGEDTGSEFAIDKKGKFAVVLTYGHLTKVNLEDGKTDPVEFNSEMNLNPAAERAYIFEHAWRQTLEKFYVTDMNRVDWNYYKSVYAKFLPTIENNYDFAELLSEMLGELNASHTGSGYLPHLPGADSTAALGVFYDETWRGAGLKVAEVIEKGPLVVAQSKIKAGMVIQKINGVEITAGMDWCPLLNRLAHKPTLLTVLNPAESKTFQETVKPVTLREQEELLYQRWIKSRRELVEKLSGGKIGYVHVRGMDDEGYRHTFSEILGRESNKLALVVDTRFNGGGNLHDELATLLDGKRYLQFLPRGQDLGYEPVNKWTQPTALLVGESNYSDAHLFPWTYQHFALGKIVGMPVPGTGTAVWWETQIDPSLYFGIPEVGFVDKEGAFMEHAAVEPDVKVPNDYQSVATGEDKQVEKVVEILLQEIKDAPK